MAKETVTRLVDDLDGGAATETVAFSWGGTSYEIDLSKKNSAAFGKAVAPYVSASRKVSTARKTAPAKRVSSGGNSERLQEIRAWAKANGHNVSARGRIAANIVELFNAS
jgi:Lsr2